MDVKLNQSELEEADPWKSWQSQSAKVSTKTKGGGKRKQRGGKPGGGGPGGMPDIDSIDFSKIDMNKLTKELGRAMPGMPPPPAGQDMNQLFADLQKSGALKGMMGSMFGNLGTQVVQSLLSLFSLFLFSLFSLSLSLSLSRSLSLSLSLFVLKALSVCPEN